jgi:Kdo2-lipid IVA lauroyltransferase/acyltransferase
MTMPLRHIFEYIAVRGLMNLFGVLPLDTASALGGWMGRMIGPMTGIHRKARSQIKSILVNHDADKILNDMWDNLGRTMAEYPHLATIARDRITLDDRAHLDLNDFPNHPALFIGGHFANWEIAGPFMLNYTGVPLDLLYRAPNNKGVDSLLNHYRSMNGQLRTIPKTRTGMRALMDSLKSNRKVGILIDQKYNEGLLLPFFGQNAMTSPAFVQLGQKFKCPVYPAQVIRENGAHFKIILHPTLKLFEDDQPRPVEAVIHDAHQLLEQWMFEHPAQWLWVHQRWSSARDRLEDDGEAE